MYKVTVSMQSEVLGLCFYPHPSSKDGRTTKKQFSESGIWDCKVVVVRDTQSKEFGEYEIWPDVPCTPFSWPPHLWLLMSWRNPWPPLALDKSDRDSHHWLHKSPLASLKRKLENVHSSRTLLLSPPQYTCSLLSFMLKPTEQTFFIF